MERAPYKPWFSMDVPYGFWLFDKERSECNAWWVENIL
jgi:hypothetical protein